MRKLLIISLDALGDVFFERMLTRPHFAALAARSAVRRGVESVFLTNTYPIHTSVATGVTPEAHGLINNTEPFPKRHPRWCYEARQIKAKTLWQAAAEKGLTTATVMWPVTGGDKSIRWNIPEILTLPGESQVRQNLRYGSVRLQLAAVLRHRALMKGIPHQPTVDVFATACMVDILREKKPDLAMMHLTGFDTFCHKYGLAAAELDTAMDTLDGNLGKLLDAAGTDTDVIVFSDHAQLDVRTRLLPNEILQKAGKLDIKDDVYVEDEAKCFFECSGGVAFLHQGQLDATEIATIRAKVEALKGFARFLTDDEMRVCGRAGLAFGFAVQAGYACEAYDGKEERANHGYPVDYEGYKVFYMACGPSFPKGTVWGGSLLDIAPMAAARLGLAGFAQ